MRPPTGKPAERAVAMLESLSPYIIAVWIACGILGGIVGNEKNAMGGGLLLGFIFGPFGLIAALWLDSRPMCPQCKGRLNGEASVCPFCHIAIGWITKRGDFSETVRVPLPADEVQKHQQEIARQRAERQQEIGAKGLSAKQSRRRRPTKSRRRPMRRDNTKRPSAAQKSPRNSPPIPPAPPVSPGRNPVPPPRR